MKLTEYIGRMVVLSLVLTVILNVLLWALRYIPFTLFMEWVWRFEVGNTVLVIPWFAMIVLSVLFTLIQYIVRYIRLKR